MLPAPKLATGLADATAMWRVARQILPSACDQMVVATRSRHLPVPGENFHRISNASFLPSIWRPPVTTGAGTPRYGYPRLLLIVTDHKHRASNKQTESRSRWATSKPDRDHRDAAGSEIAHATINLFRFFRSQFAHFHSKTPGKIGTDPLRHRIG
ncbi:hypothetical protein XFF6990_140197 [Xanthomonas citri pv. fuscans]|nr:hypothetical protein XFF6990_140197 [Xanthomonas citri pv. fuscans]